MPLKLHQPAPDFTLPSTSGYNYTLSQQHAGKPCILYFYPKDFTSVCTKEACSFRDSFATFKDLAIDVLGISQDSIEIHLQFKKENGLPFDLLSDIHGKVAKQYKAIIPLLGITRRITYLLDRDHYIAAAYENMFGAESHIKNMIDKVKKTGI